MSDAAVAFVLGAGFGAVVAWAGARTALEDPPEVLVRVNLSGALVPAVLGGWVVAGGVSAIALLWTLTELRRWPVAGLGRVAAAAVVVLVTMAVAGRWDDRRGDERPRGFAGHLTAAAGGRITGGIVKILAAGGAGAAAGLLLDPGDGVTIALTTAAVALAANLVNLLDRAPGRAGKVALLAALVLAGFGSAAWAVAAAGTIGALAAVLPADLSARGMLGDAGANPIGALLGLGLVASVETPVLAASVAVLLALNLASERWSFSRVIERTPPLRAFDEWGRK
ncbi:MAG: hypothetical protein ABR613_00275 [Actinomycetota bacterium]